MPSKAKTMFVAVKFRKKPVENMLPIVLDIIKQSFVSLFSELGRSWILGAIILETNTTTDKSNENSNRLHRSSCKTACQVLGHKGRHG